MPKLKTIQAGIVKVHALRSPDRKDTRLPITPEILCKIRAVWSPRGREHDVIMLWAACTLTFFGFFRAGEVTIPSESDFDPSKHLVAQDIAIDSRENPSLLKVFLKASKTGIDVYIGKTGDDLCPVAAMLAYLAVRGYSVGPLSNSKTAKASLRTDSFMGFEQLSKRQESRLRITKGTASVSGLPQQQPARGIEDSVIKALGRWHSSAYLLYIRIPREQLAKITHALSTQ